ncbi:hypothetical protein PVK06_041296 [Gossypium arboreum]|uniref:DUF4283 domain-containing protein n=1 Tax=Gossypium arboreum TaxID=29729 RepID=A0ABR0N8N3_GOSAR|nr:hypothetical protein PVK06_041296 [Gossypium arboreum]
MANINTVDEDLVNLNIMDEEGNPMVVIGDDTAIEQLYELYLHPLRGVAIMDVQDKRILFRFYSEIDLKRVMDSMLWFFNRHLIVFHKLTGDIPVEFEDEKKRQKFNLEIGSPGNNRELLELGLENERSAATNKLADRRRIPNFGRLNFKYVPREANKAAHKMAMKGRRYENPQYKIEEVPNTVEGLVNRDRRSGNDGG